MITRSTPSTRIALLVLGLTGAGCKNGSDGLAGTCTASLGATSWTALQGISLDIPFQGQDISVTTTEEPSGGCSVYGTGTVTAPGGAQLPTQNIEFPGVWDLGSLPEPGTYTLHGDVFSASASYQPAEGQLDGTVYVAPRPDCNHLSAPTIDGRSSLTAGDVLDLSAAQMSCLAGSDPTTENPPVAPGTTVGHVSAFDLHASGGGHLVGGHDADMCSFPLRDGESCSLEVTGPDNVTLSTSGLLQTDTDPAEVYVDAYSSTTVMPVAYAPMINCTVSNLAPDVGTNDLEVVVESGVADGSSVTLNWVTSVTRADGVHKTVVSDSTLAHANETYHLALLDELVLARAAGEIEYVVTATSASGDQESCVGSIPVAELDPPGNWVRPTNLDAAISPVGVLDTSGSFELRVVVRPDDAYDGGYLDFTSDDEHLTVRRERDTVYLEYGAFLSSGQGYGFGAYDEGLLVAPLGRLGATPLTQEIRVSVAPDAMYLAVDGEIFDWVDREFDFSGLRTTTPRLGDAMLAQFESFGFFPGYPAGGLPWATPCASSRMTSGAWCADFDALTGNLTQGQVVEEPTGSFTVGGSFDMGTY